MAVDELSVFADNEISPRDGERGKREREKERDQARQAENKREETDRDDRTDVCVVKRGEKSEKQAYHDDDKYFGEKCERKPKGYDQRCDLVVGSQRHKEMHCWTCTCGEEQTTGWNRRG